MTNQTIYLREAVAELIAGNEETAWTIASLDPTLNEGVTKAQWLEFARKAMATAQARQAAPAPAAAPRAPAPRVFEVGKTYWTRSLCDYDHVISATIVSRTAKTVKAETSRGVKTFRIRADYNGNESFQPWGNFSMAPTISAEKVAKD
jgi:hypothetical protein